MSLIAIRKPTHTAHDTENIVVSGIDANLGGVGGLDGRIREDKLECRVVNAREIARPTWLVLLRP